MCQPARADTGCMRVIAIPGFADTPRYWVGCLRSSLPGKTTHALEWPGLWGRPSRTGPVRTMLEDVASLITDDSVLVAHSFGARVALAAAQTARPSGLVLLAPALSTPSFLAIGEIERWKDSGCRSTTRADPLTGGAITFAVPVAFAEDAAEMCLLPLSLPDLPMCVVCMSSDSRQNASTEQIFRAHAVRTLDGPHRFWENASALLAVTEAVAAWSANRFADECE